MRLRAVTPVGLERALGHETYLLLVGKMSVEETLSINDRRTQGQTGPGLVYGDGKSDPPRSLAGRAALGASERAQLGLLVML